jgi:hypothetical protein
MATFDGSNDYLSTASATPIDFGASDSWAIFVVYKTIDATFGGLLAKGNSPPAPRFSSRVNIADTDDGHFVFNVNDNSTGDTFIDDDTEDFNDDALRLAAMVCDRQDDELKHYSDGVETADSGTDISSVGSLSNSQALFMGCMFPTVQHLDGDIGEAVIFKGRMSEEQINGVNQYLLDRWDI